MDIDAKSQVNLYGIVLAEKFNKNAKITVS